MSDEHSLLKGKALKALARRDHSRQELKQKLMRHSENTCLIETVLDECLQKNWQNDLRFAVLYIQSRAKKYYGQKKIRYELQQRGVPNEDIDKAFTQCEVDWEAVAKEAKQRKFGKAEADSWEERGKQNQYLYQRGF
ncbi:MAG: regulatory protein RecX [Gammaproteobacteria bacterium]|nr:regulatory protein RecX [Gammaproteobacteria bacterium]